jgi:glycosyltransferase involved in cell wall biosynthesis
VLLLDAIYINHSGGKILLDYLVEVLEERGVDTYYLFDERCKESYQSIPQERKTYMRASLIGRYKFYKGVSNKFKKILCFGNLPPNIRLQAEVYTYFHQTMFIEIPNSFSLSQRLRTKIKIVVLNLFKVNTDFWIVQTNLIKNGLSSRFNLLCERVLTIPFYRPVEGRSDVVRKASTYLYVSTAPAYKNHVRLIEAFCLFFQRHKIGELILTVGGEYSDVCDLIAQRVQEGYPIKNLGYIKRSELFEVYQKSEFLVYPSLTESFGLGLIEAIENGCKVIAADLPYTYQVCEPSIVFDPLNEESILEAMEISLTGNLTPTRPKIRNEIHTLINVLKNEG